MFSQLSGEVSVARAMRMAVSGVRPHLPLMISESVFHEIPNFWDASVMVNPRGLIMSSKRTSPGCVGFLFFIKKSP